MSIDDIKSIDKLRIMLKESQNEVKYLKKCCENVGFELAKNTYAYDYKEKNLVVQAMALNDKFRDICNENKMLIEIINKSAEKFCNNYYNTIKENEDFKIQLMQKSEVDTFFNTPIEGWDNDPCKICTYKQNYQAKEQECEELKKTNK